MSALDSHYLEPERPLRLKSGEDFALEQEAAALLAQSRQGGILVSGHIIGQVQCMQTIDTDQQNMSDVMVMCEIIVIGLCGRGARK